MNLGVAQTKVFDQFWRRLQDSSSGNFIRYDCDYPKHEFLQYLVEKYECVLHGSNFFETEILKPRKATGLGPSKELNAIYASTSTMVVIFVAILHRSNVKWFAVNGSVYALDPVSPSGVPWTEGCVYILDRTSFELRHGNWVSDQPIVPLGKLEVFPEDFPLLDKVRIQTRKEWLASGDWGYYPDRGGIKLSEAVKCRSEKRIRNYAATSFVDHYSQIKIRFRQHFCYISMCKERVEGELSYKLPGQLQREIISLYRLRYLGDEGNWVLAVYNRERSKYEFSVFPSGEIYGPPEEAIQVLAKRYLLDNNVKKG